MNFCWLDKHKYKLVNMKHGYTWFIMDPDKICLEYKPFVNDCYEPSTLLMYRCFNCGKTQTKIIRNHWSFEDLGIDVVEKADDWNLKDLCK